MNEFKFEHIGISTADIEKSIEWYNKNFGFEVTKKIDKPVFEIRGAVLKHGEFTLEILQPYNPRNSVGNNKTLVYALQKTGANHFALSVNNIISVYNKLKSAGVELVTELIEEKLFFCKDPDGTLIEVKKQQ